MIPEGGPYAAAVQHTLTVEGYLTRVLSLLQDAETGQRGFLLDRQPQLSRAFHVGNIRTRQSDREARPRSGRQYRPGPGAGQPARLVVNYKMDNC